MAGELGAGYQQYPGHSSIIWCVDFNLCVSTLNATHINYSKLPTANFLALLALSAPSGIAPISNAIMVSAVLEVIAIHKSMTCHCHKSQQLGQTFSVDQVKMLTLVNKFSILEPLSRVKGFLRGTKGFSIAKAEGVAACGIVLFHIFIYPKIGELSFICMKMFTAKLSHKRVWKVF